MKFTFGIITTDSSLSNDNLMNVLHSIEHQRIPDENYEVIIVGGDSNWKSDLVTTVAFDETKKSGWITRKKNIITQLSKYENIVYMHDYVSLRPCWYEDFHKFGNDFEVCMTPIQNVDGSRFRDWTLWPHDTTSDGSANLNALLPYDVTDLSKYMYFSGAYWIAKKKVMEEFPLDESLSWGESEDVLWSKQVRGKYQFKINPHSSVKLLKPKDPVFHEATPELIQQLRDKCNVTI
jgi:hypothetical protein